MDIVQHIQLSKKLLVLVLSLFLISVGCKPDSQTLTKEQKEELIPTIDQFNSAFVQSDITVLRSLITENYRHTNGTSEAIDKTSWSLYLNKRDKEIKTGNLVINTYEMSELNIEYYSNFAIVTGKVSISYTRKKKTTENEYRITNLWVYQAEGWKRAGFHDGKIK